MWHKVIKSKFGLQENGWDPKGCGSETYRSPWKSIFSSAIYFFNRVMWAIGDGNNIRFWKDIWLDGQAFENSFPALFRLANQPNVPISFYIDNPLCEPFDQVIWRFSFNRNLTNREAEEAAKFLAKLSTARVKVGTEDGRIWLNGNEEFSVRSMFSSLISDDSRNSFPLYRSIWKFGVLWWFLYFVGV